MIIVILLIAILGLYVLSTFCGKRHKGLDAFYEWSFTHRGLHGNGVPENSMEAFRRARENGYGIELDVHLLADGGLAVVHDSSLQRTTGVDVRVEDLTTDQLKKYFLEGTMQTVPAFADVLQMVAGRVPLIVELKTSGNNSAELCKAVCKLLDGYDGLFCLESFDPRCVFWLKKNRPDLIRGQLTENFLRDEKSKIPWIFKFAVTFQVLNFLTLPHFVAYKFQDRKHISNVLTEKLWKAPCVTWTLIEKADYDTAVKEGRIPIFEGFRP